MALSPRKEFWCFALVLTTLVGGFFSESLFGGKILSSADVLHATRSFQDLRGVDYQPANRLLMDPVLQFQPWIEFNRTMIRQGRLPLWNSRSGCGAPHLANGQSAVFDPFQVIAYLGRLPDAFVWMAAARLCFAGLGMFLLARAWSLGAWGRWFAGLSFPFCGFLVVWLLYPVTNVAIWMPWVFLATERVWERPDPRRIGWLALSVGGTLLGGHVQTSAHVLLAVGLYSLWRGWRSEWRVRGLTSWSLGVTLGVAIAAIEVVPLGFYLSKSPVWSDRERERSSPWTLIKPRVLDAACIALPYLYGSQRRGQPSLAKAVGVHNLNESAAGFAGLATLICLAPLAWSARTSQPRVVFLSALTLVGFLGAFRFPPVDNLLRALPVLGVTDNRRLGLWVASGLVLLGGIGLDRLREVRSVRLWGRWALLWVVVSTVLLVSAIGVTRYAPAIRAKALAHYAKTAETTPGADRELFRQRAERQAKEAIEFVPRYLAISSFQGLALAAIIWAIRRERIKDHRARLIIAGIALVDLLSFGFGLNPAIDRADDHPRSAVIDVLRAKVGDSGRVIGLGSELAPNTLMRFGLADARNYDSVELSRNLKWLAPLYDPTVREQTSRREIDWDRVARGRVRLYESCVKAIVAPTPPPSNFERVEQIGEVWVAWLAAAEVVEMTGAQVNFLESSRGDGWLKAKVHSRDEANFIFHETFDPGWRATIDGNPAEVFTYQGTFLAVRVSSGTHAISFVYDPLEVKISAWVSLFAAFLAVFALTRFAVFRFSGIALQQLGRTQAIGLESES